MVISATIHGYNINWKHVGRRLAALEASTETQRHVHVWLN